jgi:hypothetical protein
MSNWLFSRRRRQRRRRRYIIDVQCRKIICRNRFNVHHKTTRRYHTGKKPSWINGLTISSPVARTTDEGSPRRQCWYIWPSLFTCILGATHRRGNFISLSWRWPHFQPHQNMHRWTWTRRPVDATKVIARVVDYLPSNFLHSPFIYTVSDTGRTLEEEKCSSLSVQVIPP